jgi:serine protease AprX
MMKFQIFLLFSCFTLSSEAQQKYWVFFNDKDLTCFHPESQFDPMSIERRQRFDIEWDELDIRVNPDYVLAVQQIVDSIGLESRWFNAVSVWASETQLKKLMELDYVISYKPLHFRTLLTETATSQAVLDPELIRQAASYQIERLGASLMDSMNLTGKGVRVCVLDAGFMGMPGGRSFTHLYNSSSIIATYDFYKKTADVYHSSRHGSMVVSCIAGKEGAISTGLAPGVQLLLGRTEKEWIELKREEDAWIAGLEWADRNGADLVSSSLGYADANFHPEEGNGLSMLALAANLAVSKGMLLINSAGNEYNKGWMKIIIPADADSVLAVGATDPETDIQAMFSSVGPTVDGRLKPNICAPGVVAASDGDKWKLVSGTSFAAPLVSGFAACLFQYFKKSLSPGAMRNRIEQSGHLYPYFDYAHGFGIPQARKALFESKSKTPENFQFISSDSGFEVVLKNPVASNRASYVFVHLERPNGHLYSYNLYRLDAGEKSVKINWGIGVPNQKWYPDELTMTRPAAGETLRIHVEGETMEIRF